MPDTTDTFLLPYPLPTDPLTAGANDIKALAERLELVLPESGSGGGVAYENNWAAGTAYAAGDVVRYNGIEYLAVNPSTGSIPPAASVVKYPSCHVYHNTTQSIPQAAFTALTFNTETFDTGGIHDTTTNPSRLTCKEAGVYMMVGHVEFFTAAGIQRQLMIQLNATFTLGTSMVPVIATALNDQLTVTALYQLAVNDYVILNAYQDSGSALNATKADFAMVRLA